MSIGIRNQKSPLTKMTVRDYLKIAFPVGPITISNARIVKGFFRDKYFTLRSIVFKDCTIVECSILSSEDLIFENCKIDRGHFYKSYGDNNKENKNLVFLDSELNNTNFSDTRNIRFYRSKWYQGYMNRVTNVEQEDSLFIEVDAPKQLSKKLNIVTRPERHLVRGRAAPYTFRSDTI